MGRIRTIKPETPQAESFGRLSRDARLLFIQLWTIADDEGRARGSSRMLASLLYPYDDDAPQLIGGWLDELERNNRIRRYAVNGSTYLEIINWSEHQKIDKPSKSRLPAFSENDIQESSRSLDNIREASTTDLGPRTKDQDLERESSARASDEICVSREATEFLETIEFAKSILKEIGEDFEAPGWYGFSRTVQCWLNQKIPKDFIFAMCSRYRGKSQAYLNTTVQNSWREKQSEQQTPRKTTNGKAPANHPAASWQASKDDWRSALVELKENNRSEREQGYFEGEGTGGEIIRLTSTA